MMKDHYDRPGSAGARTILAVLLTSVLLAGCGSTVAPSTASSTARIVVGPTATTGPGSWAFAEVAQPDVVTHAPSLLPGYQCSPCHPAAASQLFGIAPVDGGFIAVGVQQPPAEAIVLRSLDGSRWQPDANWTAAEGTAAIAAASDQAHRTVVVGSATTGGAAWVEADGTWSAADGAGLTGSRGATALTAVVP